MLAGLRHGLINLRNYLEARRFNAGRVRLHWRFAWNFCYWTIGSKP